uniref:Uncharacterized protein n=1 Tax=Strongyloides stercoralis TaxID=6248 RepID=A0A0K0EPY7_STRER
NFLINLEEIVMKHFNSN